VLFAGSCTPVAKDRHKKTQKRQSKHTLSEDADVNERLTGRQVGWVFCWQSVGQLHGQHGYAMLSSCRVCQLHSIVAQSATAGDDNSSVHWWMILSVLLLCCRKDSCMRHQRSRKLDVTSMQQQTLKTGALDNVQRPTSICVLVFLGRIACTRCIDAAYCYRCRT